MTHNCALHKTSPYVDQASEEEQRSWLQSSNQMNHTIGAEGIGSLALFKHEIDSKNYTIILTRLKDHSTLEGYLQLQALGDRWHIFGVWLKAELRGKGLITNLYRALTAEGYKLRSAKILSSSAENVWKSLGAAKVARTLDTETGKTEDFNLKPVDDGDMSSGKEPRYYWVTEGQKLLTVYHRAGHIPLRENLNAWLAGDIIPGMGSVVIHSLDGS